MIMIVKDSLSYYFCKNPHYEKAYIFDDDHRVVCYYANGSNFL